jgi:exonuclease III
MSMKRFFQLVSNAGSESPEAAGGNQEDDKGGAKVRCIEREGGEAVPRLDDAQPTCFISWNADGFGCRMSKREDMNEFCALIERESPDVIALQEVRQAAAGPHKAKRGDGQPRQRGTLGTPSVKAQREETQTIEGVLRREPFSQYRVWWSLADWKYAGTALLIKKGLNPVEVKYRVDSEAGHDKDGRIILAEFDNMIVLNTYVPNNGWSEDHFGRRRAWDAQLLEFLRNVKKPLVRPPSFHFSLSLLL